MFVEVKCEAAGKWFRMPAVRPGSLSDQLANQDAIARGQQFFLSQRACLYCGEFHDFSIQVQREDKRVPVSATTIASNMVQTMLVPPVLDPTELARHRAGLRAARRDNAR